MLSETRGRRQAGPGSLVSAELGEQDTILNTAAGRGPPAALLWEQEGKLHTAPSSRHLSRTFQGSETAGRFNRGKAARPCQEQMLRSARKPSPNAGRAERQSVSQRAGLLAGGTATKGLQGLDLFRSPEPWETRKGLPEYHETLGHSATSRISKCTVAGA